MKKVLFFMHMAPPVHGVTVCNKVIAESNLINEAFETKVLPIRYGKTLADMQSSGVKKLWIMFTYIFRLLYQLCFFRPDAVYFTLAPIGSAFYRDLVFVTLVKVFRVKLILHLHGKGIAKRKGFVTNLYKYAFKNASLICLSETLSKDIDEYKNYKKLFICPNGIEYKASPKVENEKKSIDIAFFSNLLPMKGIFEFLQLANEITSLKEINFHIAGQYNTKFSEEDAKQYLLGNKGSSNCVFFHGPLYGNEKWEFLKDKDLLVHPTKNDAFPLVLLEGMASSCAIVATDQGGIPDIVTDEFGRIVPTCNYKELKLVVDQLIDNNQLLESMKKNAYKEFQEKYTDTKFEQRLLTIFSEVCGVV